MRAVMIEVNRRLYLDEQTGARDANFDRCRATLSLVLHRLIETATTLNPLSIELWNAYQTTVFCASVDGRPIRIKLGEADPWLDRALGDRGVTDWAYITAWNPASRVLPRSENDLRQRSVKDELARRGFATADGQGEPAAATWEPEESVLVFGIDKLEAVALGVKYGQMAIVVGRRHGPARLVPC